MKKAGWQRSLIDAAALWLAIFPAFKVLADQAHARSVDFSGAHYFWSFAFHGSWSNIAISIAIVAVYILVTAALLRVSRKKLFN